MPSCVKKIERIKKKKKKGGGKQTHMIVVVMQLCQAHRTALEPFRSCFS